MGDGIQGGIDEPKAVTRVLVGQGDDPGLERGAAAGAAAIADVAPAVAALMTRVMPV